MFPLTATTGSCFSCFLEGNGGAWDATLKTVQEVKRSQTNGSSGSRTTMTLHDFGGMQDDFSPNDFGDGSNNSDDGSSDNGSSGDGDFTPATQTYALVDSNNWNYTTALTLDGMTGTKTMVGKVETTFFAVGDGTAYEIYDYTNTEFGSVSAESETFDNYFNSSTLVDTTVTTTSTSSYSYSNSIDEYCHTDFVYDDGWLIVGGYATANGERSWDSSAHYERTVETNKEHWQHVEYDVDSFWESWSAASSSSIITTTNSGNYSDSWSSESAYLNGDWVLTGGTMTGSGSSYYKHSIQEKSELESEFLSAGYSWDEYSYGFFNSNSTSLRVVDESFTVSQAVVDGDWLTSDKSVTITEISKTTSSGEDFSNSIRGDIVNNGYYEVFDHLDGTYSSSTDMTRTNVFGLSGLVSSEWSVERQQEIDRAYGDYDYFTMCTNVSYYEYVDSSGEMYGHYYHSWMLLYDGSGVITDVTLDSNGISGAFWWCDMFNQALKTLKTPGMVNWH